MTGEVPGAVHRRDIVCCYSGKKATMCLEAEKYEQVKDTGCG